MNRHRWAHNLPASIRLQARAFLSAVWQVVLFSRRQLSRKKLIIFSVIIIGIVISLTAVSVYLGTYANRLLKAEMGRMLPKVADAWGLSVRFQDISYGMLSGTVIHDVKVSEGPSRDASPFLFAPRLRIDHSLRFRPSLHLHIDGVTFIDPELTLSRQADGRLGLSALADRVFSGEDKKDHAADLLKGRAGRYVSLGPDIVVNWKNARVRYGNGRETKAVDPVIMSRCKGSLTHDLITRKSTVKLNARAGKGSGNINFHADISGERTDAILKLKKISMEDFAAQFPSWFVADRDTALNGLVELKSSAGQEVKTIHFDGELEKFALSHWRISDHPVRNISIKMNGSVDWDREKEYLRVQSAHVGTGRLSINVQGGVSYGDKKRIESRIIAEATPIQDILSSLPADFIPTVHDAKVDGRVDMDIRLSLNTAGRQEIEFEPDVRISGFRIVRMPAAADIVRLKRPFLHKARKNGRVAKEFMVGPSNPDFVPYAKLGDYAARAALTCEDGRFFAHDGFQVKHIKESLAQNIREKRFARGASTISMQTAKNLFLSGEKSLSRKFEEMLLTYALERELGKERILEIYMNIIEWGPGIYGIGPASRYYFGKKPDTLTPVEAAFLASIIANPVRYHHMYKQGEITDNWSDYLAVILTKMKLDEEIDWQGQSLKPEFSWVKKKRLEEEQRMQKEPGKALDTASQIGGS